MALSLPLLSARVYYLTIYGFTPVLLLKPQATEGEPAWAHLSHIPSREHLTSQHPWRRRLQNKLQRDHSGLKLYQSVWQQGSLCCAKHLSLFNIWLSPQLLYRLKSLTFAFSWCIENIRSSVAFVYEMLENMETCSLLFHVQKYWRVASVIRL